MGYVHAARARKIIFADGHQFAGLTMRTRPVSMRELAELVRELAAIDEAAAAAATGTRPAEQAEQLTEAADHFDAVRGLFAGKLIDWDWEDADAGPVPPTLEGLRTVDDETFVGLVQEWMQAIAGVSDDLGKGSSAGGLSLEASLPMEALSPSLASSPSRS